MKVDNITRNDILDKDIANEFHENADGVGRDSVTAVTLGRNEAAQRIPLQILIG